MAAVDWTNPCARAKALTDAYYRLISGDAEVMIHHRTEQSERQVRFSATNLNSLRAEMIAAQTECATLNGQAVKPRRSAITIGARRGPFQGR